MIFSLLLLTSSVLASATYDVQVGYNSRLEFFPNQLTIAPGDAVRFKFMSGTHSVTMEQAGAQCQAAAQSLFDYHQPSGTTAEFVFQNEGTFNYYCAIGDHCQKGMRGSVTVSSSGSSGNSGGAGGAGGAGGGTPVSSTANNATVSPTTAISTNSSSSTNSSLSTASNGTTTANGTNGTNATSGSYASELQSVQWWLTLGAAAMTVAWM